MTTAADVYSLGIVLYEMVANSAPYKVTSQSATALEQAISEQVPRPPSAIAATPKELDNIVLKAIQKEPARRYLSVEQFSEDIRRYLAGLPVIARKDTVLYRARKFVLRNRWVVAGGSIAALGLIAGTVVATVQAHRAERRFQQIRGLTNLVIHDLGRDPQSIPGTLDIQQRLVPKTIATLDALARDSGNDSSLRVDLAMGYYRMANIQYSLDKPNTAEIETAKDNLGRAAGILEPLLARDPGNRVLRGDLGRVFAQLGWCLGGMGEYDDALAAHRRAIPLLESAEPLSETNFPKFPSRLQRSDEAMSLIALGRYREALAVVAKMPKVVQAPAMVRIFQGQGDLDGAVRMVQEFRRPKQFAGLPELVRGDLLGNPLRLNLGDPVTGIRFVREALAARELYASNDASNVFARLNTSFALQSLAEFTREMEPHQSVEAYLRVIAIQNEQLRLSPHNRAALRMIAIAQAEMALPLVKLGRASEARASLVTASAMEKALGEFRPVTEMEWGDWYLRSGDRAQARSHYEHAVTLANEWIAHRPEEMQLRRELADCYERLGAYYAAARDDSSAREWYMRSLEVWKNWTKWGVSSPYNRKRELEAQAYLQSKKK